MRVGSLFSGIGGLDLGLERAGMEIVWQCEKDEFCRRVLEEHWPDVPCYEDVKDIGGDDLERVDLIAGGFPCQDLSTAGAKEGLEGDRSSLWCEMLRIVEMLRPTWVVVENIHQGWRGWVPFVRCDLRRAGYSSLPLRLSAAELGADHRRTRAFVVAHSDSKLLREQSRWWRGEGRKIATKPLDPRWGTFESRLARSSNGISFGVDRRRALGNAVVPQVAEVIGRMIMGANKQ